MRVTIIGTGNMGRGIGTRLSAAGAQLQLLDRSPEAARALAADLGGQTQGAELGAEPVGGELVVLALPYAAVGEVIDEYGDQLADRIVVDITNPVDFDTFDGLVVPPDSSAAQEIAVRLPRSRVVKAFNTTFATTLRDGRIDGQPLDVFIASDDADAAGTVSDLVSEAGMRPVVVGPLRRSRELESMGYLHMAVQEPVDGHYRTGLKVVA